MAEPWPLVVQPDFHLENGGRFSRKENCDSAAREHAGYFLPRVVDRGRLENHAARRRRAGSWLTENADQLPLFQAKNIDAVWTVEPWGSREAELKRAAKCHWSKNPGSITTVLVSSEKFNKEKRDLCAKKFVQAHRELTDWIQKNPEEAQKSCKPN